MSAQIPKVSPRRKADAFKAAAGTLKCTCGQRLACRTVRPCGISQAVISRCNPSLGFICKSQGETKQSETELDAQPCLRKSYLIQGNPCGSALSSRSPIPLLINMHVTNSQTLHYSYFHNLIHSNRAFFFFFFKSGYNLVASLNDYDKYFLWSL